MHLPVSMMVVALATILGPFTTSVGQYAGAVTPPTRGNIAATDPSGIDAAEYERAPVALDGEVLFQVRGISAYPAKERAETIRKRIEAIAADRSVATESLRVVEMGDTSRVMAGDLLVAGFVDADAATEGVSRQLFTETVMIRSTRRSPGTTMNAARASC